MTQQELDALQGLCDGATPGEWCAVDKGNTVPSHMVVMRAIGANPISIASAISPRTGNAAFIAAARTALPALIGEVRRLQDYEVWAHRVAKLPCCNDCADTKTCDKKPEWGEVCAINCPIWRAIP